MTEMAKKMERENEIIEAAWEGILKWTKKHGMLEQRDLELIIKSYATHLNDDSGFLMALGMDKLGFVRKER